MGASILDRLNERNGTTDHTIAGALKSYIIRNGGDPTGLQNIADLVAALPEGGGGGITPTGNLPISENGTYDVTNYAEAVVNVVGGGRFVIEGSHLTYEEDHPSPISEDFPLVESVTTVGTSEGDLSDIRNGNIAYVLSLTQIFQATEDSEPETKHNVLYPRFCSKGVIGFAEPIPHSYDVENGDTAVIDFDTINDTATISSWRTRGDEMDVHYDYLNGVTYQMDGSSNDPNPFCNRVDWTLYAFTYSE